MVQLTDTESELVGELLDHLTEAIATLPNVDPDYANKIKIQKLLYLAIDEFDIPITYSWYLAGAVVPDRSIGPDTLAGPASGPSGPSQPTPSSASAAAEPQPGSPDESTTEPDTIDPILFSGDGSDTGADEPSDDLTAYVAPDELLNFYRSAIPDVWHEETMRFLQNFYQEKAPAEYRLLYIESTHLRTHLDDLVDAVESHLAGESPTRSVEMIRESIELSISDLHYYLRQHEQLSQTFDVVVEGTDLLEDVLLLLDRQTAEELTQAHLTLLRELADFFYYYVWKYPCLLISRETATGPCADELRSARAAEFETFDEQVRNRHAKLESDLEAAGLLPGPNDYPPIEDEGLAETLSDLSSQYHE